MISILLPTYNSAHVLISSIRSMLGQTLTEFELLILDDGSDDNTEDMAASVHDERIRYIKLPHRGIAATLNAGLEAARGEAIARMDAGDLSHPQRLEKQFRLLSSLPTNAIVACRYAIFSRHRLDYVVSAPVDPDETRKRLALHPSFAHSGVMYNRQFILQAGMYRDIPVEDYDLWLRISRHASFHVLNEVLHFADYEEDRLSTRNVAAKYRNIHRLQEPYYGDLNANFGISDRTEEILYRGWREYFFGQKEDARACWRALGAGLFGYPRVLLAWLGTLLPERMFLRFKEMRIKFRLKYLAAYWSSGMRDTRRVFTTLDGGADA